MTNNNSKSVSMNGKLPAELRSELLAFKKRNAIPHTTKHCPNCLKAHAVKTAKDLGLTTSIITNLVSSLDGDLGHSGFYLDQENLFKI